MQLPIAGIKYRVPGIPLCGEILSGFWRLFLYLPYHPQKCLPVVVQPKKEKGKCRERTENQTYPQSADFTGVPGEYREQCFAGCF